MLKKKQKSDFIPKKRITPISIILILYFLIISGEYYIEIGQKGTANMILLGIVLFFVSKGGKLK